MSQNNLAEQKDLGYVFSPGRRSSEPGYSRLDMVLMDTPTEEHFDPVYLRAILAQEDSVNYEMIEHPWYGDPTLRVCAGPLDLVDRKNKRVEMFTFGGELHIEVEEQLTAIIFTSPAPIILLRVHESAATLLAQEAEILLAQRCAFLESKPGEYDHRLASAAPIGLYRSILCALQERLELLPHTGNELWMHFRHVVKEEARFLDDEIPGPCSRLEDIL
ncbi:MAG: hypothetical protein MUC85_01050 [Anaerolineales bacterium]|jgi:hypothetical protein|nr:hypothetical protein [Anaerolineales bacterium]